MQFAKTLQYSAELFADLGFTDEASRYASLEKSIRESVVKNCWVLEKGMFAETPKKEQFSQHTNIMAILTDAIPQGEQKIVMQKILDDKSIIQTTIYYKYYLFNALHKVGMGNQYTSLLENWTNQLDQGLTTFAETDIEPRSECHAWSASPNHHFLKIIAGIYPKSKHFKEIMIEPHFNGLKAFKATMPHPNGEIKVELLKKRKKLIGSITLPKGTTGVFKWNGKEMQLTEGIKEIKIKNN